MFKSKSVANFEIGGHQAQFMIDNNMSVENVQIILNKLTHFCVERIIEAENEEAQRIKDEEAVKPPELEPAEELEQIKE